MSAEQIAELRRLREAATQGKWKQYDRTFGTEIEAENGGERVATDMRSCNAAFIAAAANSIVPMLDALAAKDAEIERLRKTVKELALEQRSE